MRVMVIGSKEKKFTKLALEKYSKFINPIDLLDKNAYTQDDKLIFRLLQMELIKLLNKFLNGDTLTRTGVLFFPFVNRQKNIGDGFFSLLYLTNLRKNYFSGSRVMLASLSEKRAIYPNDYAELVSILYQEVYEYAEKLRLETNSTSVKVPLDYEEWSNKIEKEEYLAPAAKLRDQLLELESYITGFYFHGSVASLDYIPNWSDLDDLVILKKDTVLNPSKLKIFQEQIFQTKSQLYLFDPIQHHGHAFFSEMDMMYFPQSFFPLMLFETAVCCFGANKLLFQLRNDEFERVRNVMSLVKSLDKMNDESLSRPYVLKTYISLLMLLPSMYLQVKNINCSKKDSFELAKNDFGDDWKAIDISSDMREQWRFKKSSRWFREFLIKYPNPNYIMIWHYFFNALPHDIRKGVDNLIPSSNRFTNRLIENLENEGYLHAT